MSQLVLNLKLSIIRRLNLKSYLIRRLFKKPFAEDSELAAQDKTRVATNARYKIMISMP